MKLHEVRSEWWGATVELTISCPFKPEEERGCRLNEDYDGEHCAARHYLTAGGPEAIRLFGQGPAPLPFVAQVYWVDDEVVVVKPVVAYYRCTWCNVAFDEGCEAHACTKRGRHPVESPVAP